MLADTVQDNIGAKFGVSGAVVVIAVILFVVFLVDQTDKNKAKTPSPTTGTVGTTTKACADGGHDRCPGEYRSEDGSTGDCKCTCHRAPMSALCGDLGRHDACEGRVRMPSGDVRDCGCTCHAKSTSR